MNVSDVMRKATVSLAQNATLKDVAQTFLRHNLDLLPIVDAAQHVVGVLTPTDLLDVIFPRFHNVLRDYAALEDKGQLSILFDAAFASLDIADERLILAADVMRTNFIWVTMEETLLSAASRLFGQNVTQLPVVDRDRRLMGLLSQTEIVLALLRGNKGMTAAKRLHA
jgi:CBS domain-containing membrane protein